MNKLEFNVVNVLYEVIRPARSRTPEARYLFSPHSKQVRFPSPTQPAGGREQEEVLSSLPTERQGDLDWDWP